MSDPTWEEAWPEAEDALKQAAREHAAMLSREREKAMTASRKARASEKALRALPAALQRAQTAEAALRELQELHNPPTGSTSKPPPPPLEPAAISEEAAAAATAAAEAPPAPVAARASTASLSKNMHMLSMLDKMAPRPLLDPMRKRVEKQTAKPAGVPQSSQVEAEEVDDEPLDPGPVQFRVI